MIRISTKTFLHSVAPFLENLFKGVDKIFMNVTVDSTFIVYEHILIAVIAVQDGFLKI